jgi:parallel beta-helix repeat protein
MPQFLRRAIFGGRHPAHPARCRPRLLALEDRVVPSTLTVDDDRVQRPDAQFTTIQAAVAAAHSGDTIRVFPGTYTGPVVVNKTLSLLGEGPAPADRTGNPLREAVVRGNSPDGIIQLRANNVLLRGFTILDNQDGPGVVTSRSFSGYQIERNLFQGSTDGLDLGNGGSRPAVVTRNVFRDNNSQDFGNGIASTTGLRNAVIEDNVFTQQDNYSVLLSPVTGTIAGAVVRNNRITDSGGILVSDATDVAVTNNRVTRAVSTGVYLFGDVRNALVARNTITGGDFSGIVIGSPPTFEGNPGPVSNVVVTHNTVRDNDQYGVIVSNSTQITVDRNRIEGNAKDGILLENADDNAIRHNTVRDNGGDGIHVNADSTGNRITRNKLRDNGGFDAFDASTGTRTAGTANFWDDNKCRTENRPGLCEHPRKDHDHDRDDDHDDDGDDD